MSIILYAKEYYLHEHDKNGNQQSLNNKIRGVGQAFPPQNLL